jgi:UDP-N-acetylmuramate dehydrogenase
MIINKNVSLKGYNTFGLNYLADCIIHLKNEKEAKSVFDGSVSYKEPLIIIGGGSNLLFTGDFKGTIIHPVIKGIRLVKEESSMVIISAGADVKWDDLVEWSVERGFSGLENLSLIPGSVGASAVQNIGAYGVEVKDSILKVKTLAVNNGVTRVFSNSECEFGYRSSVFKKSQKGKYLITRVYFKLNTSQMLNLGYGSLKEEVLKLGGPTLKNVRKAVINIREAKLPDPEIIGNAGSFFKNPVVSNPIAENLRKVYPEVPVYDENNGLKKIAAGWLIEKCGWKGRREGDAGVHEKQALVLVNYGKASGRDIYNLSEIIKKSVFDKFGIELEREVEVIGLI